MIASALAWLRVNHPADEDAAIIARLEEEDRHRQLGSLGSEKADLYIAQQDPEGTALSGRSALEAIRQRRENEEAEARERRAKALTEITAPANNITGKPVVARRSESAQWVQKYKQKAVLSTDVKPPEMSHWQRLWPSTLITFAIVGLSILLAQNYTPPKRSTRLFPDLPPAAATILALININFAVFLLWRLPPAWMFLNRYFMMIPGAPRAFSMIGAVFSHQKPLHLMTNMAFLWYFGSKLHNDIGRGSFLAVYLSTGVLSSYFSLTVNVLRRSLTTSSVGASGAVMGVMATWLFIHSDAGFSFIFLPPDLLPPLSSNLVLFCLVALEVTGISLKWRRSDHLGHLGGLLSGIASAHILKDRARQRKEAEELRRKNLSFIDRVKEGRI
ncbi:hypothetical protein MMC08_003643 [Hypocenomyce scalaris]|nr:hypothetical protein [Hypocenomyce scalaris]